MSEPNFQHKHTWKGNEETNQGTAHFFSETEHGVVLDNFRDFNYLAQLFESKMKLAYRAGQHSVLRHVQRLVNEL